MTAVDDFHGATTSHATGGANGHAPTRAELVKDAVAGWRDELASLVGRDPLLSYRDLKVGTLDLAAAEPETRKQLLDGEPVYVSKLFPHEPLRSSSLRSARAIRNTARELWEDRGVSACMLAVGVATWSNPFAAHRPAAPVLLRAASVTARDPAETDFQIEIADVPVVNPMLTHALDTQLGLRFMSDDLLDVSGELKYTTVVERLREFAPAHVVDGFSIAHRAVISTFSTEPLLLADDVALLGTELAESDVVAALAGDDAARSAIGEVPESTSVEHEVLDTDDDQSAAVAAVASGACVNVTAPPGSGRTQTIAATVAELIGRGKSVLVVSPRRNAIGDLTRRLERVGLRELALDVGAEPPANAVVRVSETARKLSATTTPELSDTAEYDRLRDYVVGYRQALHRRREPWATTLFDAIGVLAQTPSRARTSVRVDTDRLARVGSLRTIQTWIREYAELGGLTMTPDESPWHGSAVTTESDAAEALATVTHLHRNAAPALRDTAVRAAVEVGLAGPTSLSECLDVVELLSSVAETIHRFGDQIWDEPLDELIYVTAGRRQRSELEAPALGYLARRRMRQRAARLAGVARRAARGDVHGWLVAAREQLAQWRARSRGARLPRTGPHLKAAVEAAAVVRARLDTLVRANDRAADIATLEYAAASRRFTELLKSQDQLRALPRLRDLYMKIEAAGVSELVDELRGSRPAPERLDAMVRYMWHASLLDRWCREDQVLSAFDAATHEQRIDEFEAADRALLRAGVGRVLAARAKTFEQAAADHEGQAAVISEMGPQPAVASTRGLLEAVPDLALAAVPCWMMSPYDVATCLPPKRLFDVVIVDGGGLLPVAHTVPAIARAHQLVVVRDDDAALGPFTVTADRLVEVADSDAAVNESSPVTLADAVAGTLPRAQLGGQYRIQDDQLVNALPAAGIAPGRRTYPSAWEPGRLGVEVVDVPAGDDGPVDSSTAEVSRVVELVLEHLRTRPHESLGVVTVSAHHARRLDEALRRALVRAPDVATALDETREEPFFIKDVGRIGGDVRDAIIFSLGYGRSVDGRILYRFGALGRPDGERRLATALTRARDRLTVVSTFGPDDLSERRLSSDGARALWRFLVYARSGPAQPGTGEAGPDSLAAAIAERLRAAGAEVDVGYADAPGVAVVARHPTRKRRLVLAVTTDGPVPAMNDAVRQVHRIQPTQLRQLGWSVHRVWSMAWLRDPEGEARRLVAAYEQAVADADAFDWAVAAAEADVVAGMPDEEETAGTEDPQVPDEQAAERAGPRPDVPHTVKPALIGELGTRTVVALARWVESDAVPRTEDAAVCSVAAELGNAVDDPAELEARGRDILRHAVRVARAGAPSEL